MAWSREDDTKLREMWAAGHTVPMIASALSRNTSTVKARRKSLDLPARRTGDLTEKVRVGFHPDTMDLFRKKSLREGQTVNGRIRSLVEQDLTKP